MTSGDPDHSIILNNDITYTQQPHAGLLAVAEEDVLDWISRIHQMNMEVNGIFIAQQWTFWS